jgi:molybdopterin-guanine dinucleotide biosynthesis protein A
MIPGCILAGGRSQRMGGGDKFLRRLGEATLLEHVISSLRPQTGALLINSNSDPALFADTGLEVRADVVPGWLGPLAGIHTAMLWGREMGAEAVLTAPADTPFLPLDLVARLAAARGAGQAAIAASGGALHPVVGLWPCALAEVLRETLAGGEYRVRDWLGRISYAVVEFEAGGADPFANINTPEELQRTRAAVAGR